jgi:spore coat protein A
VLRSLPAIRATILAISVLASAANEALAQPLPSDLLTVQTPLAPKAIPQFVDPMPVLDVTPEPLWAGYPKFATVLPSELSLDPATHEPLPFTLRMCEFQANILPTGTFAPGQKPATYVWGYRKGTCPPRNAPQDTYLGPVFVTSRNIPTPIRYVNDLPRNPEPWSESNPEGTSLIAYRDSVDQTLHWANPNMLMCMSGMKADDGCRFPFRSTKDEWGIPAVPHLHGGEVPAELDGGPEAWFTSTGNMNGATYYHDPVFAPESNEIVYRYPNTQEAGPLWFHDHTLGATRLNVYAGLAGAYMLVDLAQNVPDSLKDATRIVPIVLQDRMFDTKGELFFTSGTKGNILWALNPEHPYWNPEFVGDTIVVNGKAWPYLEVEPKRYRFLFVNGSNARTYELFLTNTKTNVNGPAMWIVGTDGGFVDVAQKLDPALPKPAPQRLVIMPGERYEVLVDFSAQPVGTTLLLKNIAKTPYPAGATPAGGLGRIMQLRVVACPLNSTTKACETPGIAYDPVADPNVRGVPDKVVKLVDFANATLGPGVTVQKTRLLTLNEVMGMPVSATNPIDDTMTAYPGGPLEILVNNTKYSGKSARNTAEGTTSYRGDFSQVAAGGLYYSEIPNEGETELWEIANLTADSHPIHLHLVQFQLLNRQTLDVPKYSAAYAAAFPAVLDDEGAPLMIGMNVCSAGAYCPGYGPPLDYFTGTTGKLGGNPDVVGFLKSVPQPPAAQERGWKDTVQVPPGMVTRFVVRWAPTSAEVGSATPFPFDPSGGGGVFNYVWHCHIIDHEDNEMMRPSTITPMTPAPTRTYVKGTDY